MQGPLSPVGRRVILRLLREPGVKVSARSLAAAAGVGRQAAGDVLRFLEFHGAIDPRPRSGVRWRRLADLAAKLRIADMVPAARVSARGEPKMLSETLAEAGVRHVLGYTTAANFWAFFQPAPTNQILVPRRHLADAAAAIRDPHGARRGPTVDVDLFADDVGSLETTTIQGVPLTTQLQTWIDLQHFPFAAAHAAFFQAVVQNEFPEAWPR